MPEVRAVCRHQLTQHGGRGAVREFVEDFLKARGEWDVAWNRYVDARSTIPRREASHDRRARSSSAGAASCAWSARRWRRSRSGWATSSPRAVRLIAESTGRVIVAGVGKSGLIGRKIAATLTSTGTPASFLHPVDSVHGDLGIVGRDDVAILISKSGESDELLALLAHLKGFGVRTIAITGDTGVGAGPEL